MIKREKLLCSSDYMTTERLAEFVRRAMCLEEITPGGICALTVGT